MASRNAIIDPCIHGNNPHSCAYCKPTTHTYPILDTDSDSGAAPYAYHFADDCTLCHAASNPHPAANLNPIPNGYSIRFEPVEEPDSDAGGADTDSGPAGPERESGAAGAFCFGDPVTPRTSRDSNACGVCHSVHPNGDPNAYSK